MDSSSHGRPYEFDALTVIDTVTNLVELIRVEDKTSDTIARKYAQCWLSRYPWPQRCIHDPGGEFTFAEGWPPSFLGFPFVHSQIEGRGGTGGNGLQLTRRPHHDRLQYNGTTPTAMQA